MITALVSRQFVAGFGDELKAVAAPAGKAVAFMTLPAEKGARLINIGRGEVVDEAAFIDAIRSGHLAGAALDAHRQEPLPADSPLWDLPNVIISPHNASASTDNENAAPRCLSPISGAGCAARPCSTCSASRNIVPCVRPPKPHKWCRATLIRQ